MRIGESTAAHAAGFKMNALAITLLVIGGLLLLTGCTIIISVVSLRTGKSIVKTTPIRPPSPLPPKRRKRQNFGNGSDL